jgi:hypothetical protein
MNTSFQEFHNQHTPFNERTPAGKVLLIATSHNTQAFGINDSTIERKLEITEQTTAREIHAKIEAALQKLEEGMVIFDADEFDSDFGLEEYDTEEGDEEIDKMVEEDIKTALIENNKLILQEIKRWVPTEDIAENRLKDFSEQPNQKAGSILLGMESRDPTCLPFSFMLDGKLLISEVLKIKETDDLNEIMSKIDAEIRDIEEYIFTEKDTIEEEEEELKEGEIMQLKVLKEWLAAE